MTTSTQLSSQQSLQKKLAEMFSTTGLSSALNYLYDWSVNSGYIDPSLLAKNAVFYYPDENYDLTFKAQVNYARDAYKASAGGSDHLVTGCPICFDNIGKAHKPLLRALEFPLAGRDFFIQLTPFPVTPYHFVLIAKKHYPMQVDKQSVVDLIDFVDQAPEYVACSNSDIEWAGSSVREHHHYQVFGQ